MGIKGLQKFLQDEAPNALKMYPFTSLFGRKLAVDASMCLYQFLAAVRTGPDDQNQTNAEGEITSHLQGQFYRTLRMLDQGVKPIYVFDGKPPVLKSSELAKRSEKRQEAEEAAKLAKDEEKYELANKFNRRTIHVTREQNEESKKLLRLMGIPVVEAPSEAEATCAELVKKNIVSAVATEDMDALTFGAPKLLRNVTAAASKNLDIIEIDLERILTELDLTYDQFIELCILMGCDYTSSIRGIGPNKAYELIRKYSNIEEGIKTLNTAKYIIPEDFLYKEATNFFKNPEVVDTDTLKTSWEPPDEEGILTFLCDEKNFSRERVQAGLERMKKARTKTQQQRLDSYFKPAPKTQQEVEIMQRKRNKKGDANKTNDKRQKTK